jgi:hypothetical protein
MTTETHLLREALTKIKYKAVSLGDAQVIALEALSAPAASPIEAQAQLREWVNPKGEIQRTYISEGPITGRTYTLQPSGKIAGRVLGKGQAIVYDTDLPDGTKLYTALQLVQTAESAIRALSSAKRALMNWCNLHPDEKGALDTIALEAIDKALTAAQAEGERK